MGEDVASELARSVVQLDDDWRRTQDDLDLPTVALGHLARRVIELDQTESPPDWSTLFDDVERRLSVADAAGREILVTGFLEGLQNNSLNGGLDPARWEPLLGRTTRTAWSALNDLWAGRMTPKKWSALMSRDIKRR